jgi:hypothetical protein
MHLTWALIVGTSDAPGLLQLLREPFAGRRPIGALAMAVWRGRFAGLRTVAGTPRDLSVPKA